MRTNEDCVRMNFEFCSKTKISAENAEMWSNCEKSVVMAIFVLSFKLLLSDM